MAELVRATSRQLHSERDRQVSEFAMQPMSCRFYTERWTPEDPGPDFCKSPWPGAHTSQLAGGVLSEHLLVMLDCCSSEADSTIQPGQVTQEQKDPGTRMNEKEATVECGSGMSFFCPHFPGEGKLVQEVKPDPGPPLAGWWDWGNHAHCLTLGQALVWFGTGDVPAQVHVDGRAAFGEPGGHEVAGGKSWGQELRNGVWRAGSRSLSAFACTQMTGGLQLGTFRLPLGWG